MYKKKFKIQPAQGWNRVFIWHQRSENSACAMQISPANVW